MVNLLPRGEMSPELSIPCTDTMMRNHGTARAAAAFNNLILMLLMTIDPRGQNIKKTCHYAVFPQFLPIVLVLIVTPVEIISFISS